MEKENKKHSVEYACDCNGDHTAIMSECTESRIKDFDTENEAAIFAFECTYTYNLNDIVGVDQPIFSNPVLDCIDDMYV